MTDSPSTEPQTEAPPEAEHFTPAEGVEVPNVHQAMAHAMARVRAVGKWGRNAEQGYNFRSIDDFMTALSPAMAAAGVHIAPKVLQRITDESHNTSGGKIMRWVDVEMEFTFYGPAGDTFTVVTWGEARDAADKATNKAMTGAFKYAIMQAFMVPTQDLADGDADNPEVERAPQGQRQQAPPPPPANADPATVDALRSELLAIVDEVPPGPPRDLGLRAVYGKAAHEEALGCMVDIPEAWRTTDVVQVSLLQLINGARTINVPSGETPAESAGDEAGEPQETPPAAGGHEETAEPPSAPQEPAQGAVAKARARADQAHAERSTRLEEDPWASN